MSGRFSIKLNDLTRRSMRVLAALFIAMLLPANFSAAQEAVKPSATSSSEGERVSGNATTTENELTIPEFHLTRVKLDAEEMNDRVNILATVEIVINRGEGWHRIPLRFSQAHVWSREYNGPGEEMPDVTTKSVDDGMFWMIKGIGKHELKLSMWVPFKQTLSGTQFQLSLPPLPPQFETELNLTTSGPTDMLRGNKFVRLLDISRTETQTKFTSSVAGSRIDVSWHRPVFNGATIAQSSTRLHVKPTGDQVMLFAQQTIDSYEQSEQEVLVRLPSDFVLESVSGAEYRSHAPVEDREGWVRVQLKSAQNKRFELNWILSRPLGTELSQVKVDGFEVDGAVREDGAIRVDEFDGYRVNPLPDASVDVHRTNVNDVRSFGVGTALTAFVFYQQPFELNLQLSPLEAFYVAKPFYQLVLQDDEAVLHVHNLISFNRGSLTQLELEWPEFEEAGWSFVGVNSDQSETGMVTEQLSKDGIVLQWPRAQQQEFMISARFSKPLEMAIDPSADREIQITLPATKSSRTEVGVLEIRAADHLSVQLRDGVGQDLSAVEFDSVRFYQQATAVREIPQDTVARVRLAEQNSELHVKVKTEERQVVAKSLTEIRDVAHGELTVQQTVSFDVSFGQLQILEVNLPDVLLAEYPDFLATESVDISLNGELIPKTFSAGKLRVVLPKALKGEFDLQFRYSFQVDTEGDEKMMTLPLLTVVGIPFDLVKCMVLPVESVQVRKEEGWTAIRNSLWVSVPGETPAESIPLTLDYLLADSSQQYVIERAWYRTRFLLDGSTETWAEFRLNSPPARILFSLPKTVDVKKVSILLDGESLEEDQWKFTTAETSHQLTLSLPELLDETPILSIQYRQANGPKFGLTHLRQVALPEFPKSVWIDETIWETLLPRGNHLFTYPALDPQFEWQRGVLFWERQLTSSYLEEREKLETGQVPKEFEFAKLGHFYAFRGFGPVKQVEFRAMNQSLILLMGAGLTLLLGFVFWTFPYTRNVFSLVVISFLFSVASLWYWEPMQLLLQPAVLGVFLALTVTMIDSASRRKRSQEQDKTVHQVPVDHGHASTQMYVPVSAGSSKLSNR